MSHIFISYSHLDNDFAHLLASSLQSKGFDVWIDVRLDYGSQWPHEIQKRLDSCDAFILLMTPRSFESQWVQSELQRAKRKAKPIFPLLLEGDEPWLSVESTQYYDCRGSKLPDEMFYYDLKRSVSVMKTPMSRLPSTAKNVIIPKTAPPEPEPRKTGIYVAMGSFAAVFSVCLILGFMLLQKIDSSGLIAAFPTGFSASTAQPTLLENGIPDAVIAPTAVESVGIEPVAVSLPVELPDGSNATMISSSGSEYQYKILSAQREPIPPAKQLLRLRFRIWTNNSYGMWFEDDDFRLAVGELRMAPVNSFSEAPSRDETFDGDVEFEIDASIKEAILVISMNSESWSVRELRLQFP